MPILSLDVTSATQAFSTQIDHLLYYFDDSVMLDFILFSAALGLGLALRGGSSKGKRNGPLNWLGCSAGAPTPMHVPTKVQEKHAVTSSNPVGEANARSSRSTRQPKPADVPSKIVAAHGNGLKWQAARALQLYVDSRSEMVAGPPELYELLVNSAMRFGQPELVLQIVDDMVRDSVPRSASFYELAMKQLAGNKQHRLALLVYDRLAADGLKPSEVTLSCLIRFASEVGDLDRAVAFFDELALVATPSIRAYTTMLRVHAQRKDWKSTLAIFRDMEHRLATVDTLTFNIALATGVDADELDGVESLLAEIIERKPALPDVVSHNTVLKGYARRGDSRRALDLLDKMCRADTAHSAPNAISFNTAMNAAMLDSQPSKAWELLAAARAEGFKPDKFSCTTVVKDLKKCAAIEPEHLSHCLALLSECGSTCDVKLRASLFHDLLNAAPSVKLRMQIFTEMRRQQVEMQPAAQRLLVRDLQ